MIGILRHLVDHPLNRSGRLDAILRFARWQLSVRLMPCPHFVPFVEDTVLVMERGMTGATGNWYSGFHEHADMGFVLHMLRPDDLFIDIGTNVGSYTVLAAGCAGATVISVKPIPGTFAKLKRKVRVNELGDRVTCCNIGTGRDESMLRFTSGLDTTNHVIGDGEVYDGPTVEVPVRPVDSLLDGRVPRLMKIDVEGWEIAVDKGMPQTLADPHLAAIITETNSTANRYDVGGQDEVDRIMMDAGFKPCSYDPIKRALTEGGTSHNTIYVRDLDFVGERIASAARFRLINGTI